MKKALCLLLILSLLPLCGCSERLDLCLMVAVLGIDVTPNELTLTVKSPDYTASEKEGGGYVTLSASGVDWAHAAMMLVATSPLTLRFGQLREVVISLDSTQHMPLPEILRHANNLQNVRAQAVVIMCEGTAQDFIQKQQPIVGKRLSKYLDLALQNDEQLGLIPTTSLAEALRDLTGLWQNPLLAYAASKPESAPPVQSGQPMAIKGGEFSREGMENAEYAGAVAFSPQGESTLLSGHEVQLFHLVKGKDQLLLLEFEGRFFALENRGKSRFSIEKTGGKSVLCLSLPVTILYSAYSGKPGDGIAASLEAEVTALFKKLQRAGCDAFGFGAQAVKDHKNLYAWRASDWQNEYQNADVRVEVTAVYSQSGRL